MNHPTRIRPLPDLEARYGLVFNILKTLMRHMPLLKSWNPLAGYLMTGPSLSPRHRELLIMRVAFQTGSDYEWGQHVLHYATLAMALKTLGVERIIFSTHATLFWIGAGGFGGESGPSTRDLNQPPGRAPDHEMRDMTREEHGAIYRLSGDRVALHIDPEFARKAGYDKPFMHGLCTYGFVGRAVLHDGKVALYQARARYHA